MVISNISANAIVGKASLGRAALIALNLATATSGAAVIYGFATESNISYAFLKQPEFPTLHDLISFSFRDTVHYVTVEPPEACNRATGRAAPLAFAPLMVATIIVGTRCKLINCWG